MQFWLKKVSFSWAQYSEIWRDPLIPLTVVIPKHCVLVRDGICVSPLEFMSYMHWTLIFLQMIQAHTEHRCQGSVTYPVCNKHTKTLVHYHCQYYQHISGTVVTKMTLIFRILTEHIFSVKISPYTRTSSWKTPRDLFGFTKPMECSSVHWNN